MNVYEFNPDGFARVDFRRIAQSVQKESRRDTGHDEDAQDQSKF